MYTVYIYMYIYECKYTYTVYIYIYILYIVIFNVAIMYITTRTTIFSRISLLVRFSLTTR